MKKVNVGVIGYGYWGPNVARNFFENSEVNLYGVADLSEERLAVAKQKYKPQKLEKDYDELIKDPDIDAVAVITPVKSHYSIARKALEAGKHVFIEKPMTFTTGEAKELNELANRNNKVILVDHTFVYTPAVRKVRELVETGELGDILYFDSVRINLGLFQKDVNVVWDLAPHDFSILLYILEKKPTGISAMGSCHSKNGLENIAYINVFFEDDTIAHYHLNWLAPVKVRQIIIGGSKKMAILNDLNTDEKIKVYDRGITINQDDSSEVYKSLVGYRMGDMYSPQLDTSEALGVECSHFIDCIKRGEKPLTGGEMGEAVVAMLEACQDSIKNQGRVVPL